MYVTYSTRQYSDHDQWYSETQYGLFRFARPPQRFSTLPKPQFMPSKLLRVTDMRIVQGSTVNEGYCALSYSWNWSGDIIMDEANGKTKRVDHKKHKIIFSAKRVPRKPRGRKRSPRRVKFVEFEGIIQQICKDFDVKYIWYDQWCINQKEKEEKLREIRQMHKIYRNAYCTVALVPEFCSRRYLQTRALSHQQPNYPKIYTSQWMRRVWTLEEALLSPKILFVGRDIHSWGHLVKRVANLHTLCQKLPNLDVSTVLYYAHIRTTTKEHDRVFALANLFPDLMKSISISYDEPVNDLLLQFYRLLAQKDISILCFGRHKDYRRIGRPKEELAQASDVSLILKEYLSGYKHRYRYPYSVPIQVHDKILPSWTGVQGEHILPLRLEYSDYPKTTFKNYIVTEKLMQVTCASISVNEDIRSRMFFPLKQEDFPPVPQGPSADVNGVLVRWILCLSVHLPGQESSKVLSLPLSLNSQDSTYDLSKFNQKLHETLWLMAQFFPVKKENLFWWDAAWPQDSVARFEHFSLTEGVIIGCNLVILTGVRFKDNWPDWKRCPVIIKDQGAKHYRAIGTCRIGNIEYFLSGVNLPEKTFIIK
ncbi:hypothetical protein BDB00DRAFT_871076 [Zychaea mexicana]|uniref:uncharacterized protein n=1 Tax=Zychaea mexicana TaxID=64656 RepID=UPI0022FED26D|nr:uncharacterized protein BDB00DRAFT_871076 [Zychaea mexicana]KAI9494802.1 hypothetical protein BDB00DRAFT_871076 [Zychaea mexicana]